MGTDVAGHLLLRAGCAAACQTINTAKAFKTKILLYSNAIKSWQLWHRKIPFKTLESSHSPHTSTNAMLFTRLQHHIRFDSGFRYAPFKAMVTKISKWSTIQDSFRITTKIESLVVFAIPDVPRKFQKDPSITFWVMLVTDRQTDKVWQKHNLVGRGNKSAKTVESIHRWNRGSLKNLDKWLTYFLFGSRQTGEKNFVLCPSGVFVGVSFT